MDKISFITPTTIGVFGPSQSGKTTFVIDLLQHKQKLFSVPPKWLLLCYNIWQEGYDKMKLLDASELEINFHLGLPTAEQIEQLTEKRQPGIIILDDLMSQAVKDPYTENLFTTISHHLNVTVIYLAQNVYCQGKHARTMSLNMHYIVLFKNLRDSHQIQCLGRQIYPQQNRNFMEVYKDATKDRYSYLIIDLSPHGEDSLRLRSHIIPPKTPVIYQL